MSDQNEDLMLLLEIVKPILLDANGKQPSSEIPVKIKLDGDQYVLAVGGFYKHGEVTLRIKRDERDRQPKMEISGRYGVKDCYYAPSFSDLVAFNFYRWQDYKNHGYEVDQGWLPHLLKAGLVKAQTHTTYTAA